MTLHLLYYKGLDTPTSLDVVASEGLSLLEVDDGLPNPILSFNFFFKPLVSIVYTNSLK